MGTRLEDLPPQLRHLQRHPAGAGVQLALVTAGSRALTRPTGPAADVVRKAPTA